jgi:hypothetical protein
METPYTPGDWYAKDGQIVAQDTGKTLALIPYYDASNEEQTANANLMAASKELLNALNCAYLNCHKSQMTIEAITLIEQAIQKATNP